MTPSKFPWGLGFAACLAACTVGPDYHPPETVVPGAFSQPVSSTQTSKPTAPADKQSVEITRWWQSLKDQELESLVERAVTNNLDLEIALTRLQEARTEEAVLTGESLPVVEFSGAAARGTGTNSTRGRVSGPLNAATNRTGLKEITQTFGADLFWDLDLFGQYRREIEAARADTQAAAEARNTVLVTLVSDVARAYVDLRGLQKRLEVARQNVAAAQQTVDVVQTRFNRGLTNELDLTLAKRQLATQAAQVAPLAAAAVATAHRIAVLLGQSPEDLANELALPGIIPQTPETIQAGLPVDLLRRRPDIRQAERELAGATARIGVATAELFPHVAITGGLGAQGQGLGRIPVTPATFIWSAGPAAYWPLLDFGTLDALIDIQDLRTHESLISYKQTVLRAIEQVDNAIGNYAAEQDRLRSLSDALIAGQRAVNLASERYERGLTDFLNVLDAQRQEYDLEDQYASTQETVAVQFVALYQGLGGGWENYQSIPPIRQPEPAILATFHRLFAPEDPEK